ncbi:hypothetical protein B14911_10997 [Bacillus sp. NRRL B-14911]|nr:hypothetical protein B14911_10997 [Bacillus sp. NRRL B-14911]
MERALSPFLQLVVLPRKEVFKSPEIVSKEKKFALRRI